VVDDENRIRSACHQVLTECGYQVTLAEDGTRCLDWIEKAHFDIILLDLMMPAVSGLDVLARVKALHPDTVIIVITGYATVEHSIEAMKNGAFDFIPKPFTPEQLRVTVSKALEYTRALRDIAETRSRIRTMVHRLSDGVMCTNHENRIVLVNPAFVHLVGYTGSETAMGSSCDAVVPVARIRQMISQTLAVSDPETLETTEELELGDAEGGQRDVAVRCIPFRDRSGATVGVITVLHDITALRRLDRIKSEFVSMVSHEIRGPMNSVLMQLQVVLDGLAGELTQKQREMLSRASDKIGSLVTMTSELLDISRIESGLISQELEMVDLGRLLREQIDLHRPRAESVSVRLVLEAPETLPKVTATLRNMETVVSNLIVNAIKYSPSGGRVTVSAAQNGETLTIRVADTGIGISPEDQKHVFQRFFRVKDEQTRFITGTGLGLYLVKTIVEALRGRVELDSSPGKGSTFSVILPIPQSS
jgi:PAS domain S-box-containing protein